VLGAPLAGYLADRLGRGMLLVWALLVWAIVGVAGYFIYNLMLMVGTRFIVAAAAAAAVTISLAMIGDIADDGVRNRLMGFNTALMSVMGVISMPLSGFLGDIHWRMPFLMYLVMLPLAGVIYWAVKADPSTTAAAPKSQAADAAFKLPIGLMLLGLFLGVTQLAPPTYTPFALRDLGMTSSGLIASAMTAMTVFMAISSATFGYARVHMSANTMLAVAFALSAAGMGLVATATSFIPAICGLVIAGMGVGWYSPNLLSLASESATAATRGSIIGLVKGTQMSASFLAVLAFEPIWRASGPKGIFMALTAMGVLGTAYCLIRARLTRHDGAASVAGAE
jgi:MFS family permease